MSIRKQTRTLTILLVIISLLLFFTGTAVVTVNNNLQADLRTAKVTTERVYDSMVQDIGRLQMTALDYSAWDDAYTFMQTRDQSFVEENILPASLINLNLNFLGFINNQDELIGSGSIDLATGSKIDFKLPPEKWLPFALYGNDKKGGVITLPEGPFMVGQSPVTTNDYTGKPRGKAVLGRFIDDQYLAKLAEQTSADVHIFEINTSTTNAELAPFIKRINQGEMFPVKADGLKSVTGYFIVKDPNNNPAYVISATIESNFTARAIADLGYVGITMLSIGILFVLAVNTLINRVFLKRIYDLDENIRILIKNPNPDSRLVVDEKQDEISAMSQSFNTMLDTIQRIQEDYRTLVDNQGEGVVIVDSQDQILFANPASQKMFSTAGKSILGRNLRSFMDQESRERVLVQGKLREKGVSSSYEVNLVRENGTVLPIIISATPRYDANNQFVGAYGVFRDISAIKEAQRTLAESEERFRNLVEQSQVGIFLVDENGCFIEWNQAMVNTTGYRKEEVLHQTFTSFMRKVLPKEMMDDSMDQRMQIAFKQLSGSDSGMSTRHAMDVPMIRKDKKRIILDFNLFPIHSSSGTRIGGMIYDRTEQVHLQEVEKKQAALLEYIREMASSLNTTLDFNFLLERMLTFVNRVVQSETGVIYLIEEGHLRIACTRGYSQNDIPEFAIDHDLTLDDLPSLKEMYSTGKTLAIKDTYASRKWVKFDSHSWVHSFIGTPLKVKDKIIGFLNLYSASTGTYNREDMERLQAFSDLTSTAIENARMYTELQHKADTDELTKLRNRRGFFDLAGREVERANRFSHPLSALMIDLDHFKKVNDTFGHPVGDQLLVALADILKKNVRNIDLAARYGGDEFVILLPEITLENAKEVANRLVKAIRLTAIDTQNGKARVGVSIGISTLTAECNNLSSLIEVADRALYHAKEYGRGRVVSSQN